MENTQTPQIATEFNAWIAKVAFVNGKTPDEVYAMWKLYVGDYQSPIKSPAQIKREFLQWNGLETPRETVPALQGFGKGRTDYGIASIGNGLYVRTGRRK